MKLELLEALAEKAKSGNAAAINQLMWVYYHGTDEIINLVKAAQQMQKMNGSCQRALEQSGMNKALAAFEDKS